jgi:hypothetical protein
MRTAPEGIWSPFNETFVIKLNIEKFLLPLERER